MIKDTIFQGIDNKPINDLKNIINIDQLYYSPKNDVTNLGIHIFNNVLYASNYVGVCRLKDINGNNVKNKNDGTDVVLNIKPRFSLSVIEMLNYIRTDDEFDRYLAPQSIRQNQRDQVVESWEKNELFYFFEDEPPIKLEGEIARDSSIITITLFLSMLKDLCRRPLMGRMITKEENLVGKVKGKILFHKNISTNLVKGRKDKIYCQYLQFSEDILENQLLKAALLKARQFIVNYFKGLDDVNNSYSETLTYCSKVLENISSKKMTGKDGKHLKLSGVYAYYKPVINLAKIVLDEVSIDISGRANTTNYIVPYAISMERLFELYIRAYLKKNGIASYKNGDSKQYQLLKYDEKMSIFGKGAKKGVANYIGGTVKPDIVIKNIQTGEIIVFDVKYKDYTNKLYARNDRLQLLAYALIYKCSHIGIIFPTPLNGEKVNFIPQEVQSLEERVILFHQLLMDINKNIISSSSCSAESFTNYIKNLFSHP